MPMSEDVASAAVSMAGKTVAGTVDMSAKMLDALLRLLREMNEVAAKRAERKDAKKQQKQQKSVVQKDLLKDLKMKGRVSLPDLRKHAAVNGNQIVYSDQGVSKADVAVISKNAKAMGIPIAFSRAADKQNYYPCVSSADAQAFKVMLQGIIANKLNADRQKPENEREYRQIAVAKWELPFISQECQRLDIQGNFAPHPTERNQVIFIYRKIDEDSALSITNQIEQSCKELKDVKITPDSEGFVTIKDNQTGRTYSFDTSNTSEEVMVNELQDQLGFDSMKAKLTAAKFESDFLTPDQIEEFKQNDPHNAFFAFGEMYIPDPETGKESPVTEPYKMGYYACKYGDQPAFSISNPQGKTILFTADKATYKEVQHKLSQDLGIKDKALLIALTDKVIQCSRSMAKENMSTEISFARSDFDMSDPQIASGMRRTTPDGKVLVKKQPLESLSMQISRTDKETFTVTSTAMAIEFDEAGNENTAYNTRELELPLYDNKKAYDGIKTALVSQGVPLETAKNIARDTVTKAQSQPEKETVYVEQMTAKTVVCFTNSRKAEVPVRNGVVKPEEVAEALGVSAATAQKVSDIVQDDLPQYLEDAEYLNEYEQVEELLEETTDESIEEVATSSNFESEPDSELNGHEQHPEGNILNEQEAPDILGNKSEDMASTVSDTMGSFLSDDDEDSMSMGAR